MKEHTLPEDDPVYRRMIMALSPGERVAMACGMFSEAMALVRAGIISEHGGREPADLRRRIFLRFYGSDFEPAELGKILKHLRLD